MRSRCLLIAALAAVACALPLTAQPAAPKRPKLPAGADSNDAQAYLSLARRELESDAGVAYRAFWWASRLQPDLAAAWYGRAAAAMLDDGDLLEIHFAGGGDAGEKAKDRGLDSLYAVAFALDPFLHRGWDRTLLIAYAIRRAHLTGTPEELRQAEEEMSTWGVSWKAWLHYGAGRFRESLDFYQAASRRDPKNDGLLARRAELHLRLLEVDSAVKYLREAIATAVTTEKDKDRLVRLYKPKAVYEFMLGAVHERREQYAQAREAYGRALTEDLSLYVAHQRLALLALAAGDLEAAVAEFRLATEIAPANGVLRFQYAATLVKAGRLPEAVPELTRVIAAEPWYAEPYVLLARLYDASDLKDDAKANYQAFLARAPRDAPQRTLATQRLAALSAP